MVASTLAMQRISGSIPVAGGVCYYYLNQTKHFLAMMLTTYSKISVQLPTQGLEAMGTGVKSLRATLVFEYFGIWRGRVK